MLVAQSFASTWLNSCVAFPGISYLHTYSEGAQKNNEIHSTGRELHLLARMQSFADSLVETYNQSVESL